MPVITIANTKGGAGKTTAAALLAVELSHCGHSVTIFDSDPQKWISQWFEKARPRGRISLVSHVTPASMQYAAGAAKVENDYFIIDLAGETGQATATALAYSSHVLIPVQGAGMDGKGAANVLDLIGRIHAETGHHIAHSVLLSRVNPMVTTHSLLAVKGLLAQRGVNVLATPLIERSAFREMFDLGLTLYDLDPRLVSNLDKAKANAREFAAEVLRIVPARYAALALA